MCVGIMRKILIGLLLCAVIVPSFGQMLSPDSCGAPDLYTIDKRCYVTDYQKTQSPYNAVVRVAAMGGEWRCTGTIVQNGGYYYVYTDFYYRTQPELCNQYAWSICSYKQASIR